MTQEEKQLLLIDICARLPYNLYIRVEELNVPENDDRITEGFIGSYLKDNRCNDYDAEGVLNELADGCISVKPYLRPMSSMTEEEKEEFHKACEKDYNIGVNEANRYYTTKLYEEYAPLLSSYHKNDWLNKHHFDYRGLIPEGLALEAKEGMYKTK